MSEAHTPILEKESRDRLLDPNEVAALLKVRPTTLGKWRHFRLGPRYYKMHGQLVRYRLGDLLDWIESQPAISPIPPRVA
jgi:hypothetical protein